MHASDVIKQLQQLVARHGDLQVVEIDGFLSGTPSGTAKPLNNIECVSLREYVPNRVFLLSF